MWRRRQHNGGKEGWPRHKDASNGPVFHFIAELIKREREIDDFVRFNIKSIIDFLTLRFVVYAILWNECFVPHPKHGLDDIDKQIERASELYSDRNRIDFEVFEPLKLQLVGVSRR